MLAFIIGLAPYIPVMLQVAGFFIQWFGASKENIAAYGAMIEKNKDSGLISVETYKTLADFHKQLSDDLQKKEQEKPK